jgi:hypothetical protein
MAWSEVNPLFVLPAWLAHLYNNRYTAHGNCPAQVTAPAVALQAQAHTTCITWLVIFTGQ